MLRGIELGEVPLCEIGGRVLGGMQFWWWMLFCELVVGGIQLGLLVGAPLCEIDGRVNGACSLGC